MKATLRGLEMTSQIVSIRELTKTISTNNTSVRKFKGVRQNVCKVLPKSEKLP